MNLMREIVSGVWMLAESEAQSMLPIINRFLQGESVDFSHFVVKEKAYGYYGEMLSGESGPTSDKKGVLVIPVKGIITKYDYCWEMGMQSFEALLNQATHDENIGAVVLDIDSGGGEASYMVHVANALQNLKSQKPIYTYFSGYCCSAAYYIASQSTEIFASTKNDMVGSVGTMISLVRPNPENKTAEWLYERIYATKSTMKNYEFEQIMEGNQQPVRENILDPLNEEFHAKVKEGRPTLAEEVFQGVCVTAEKGLALNLIDGFKTLNETIEYAFSKIN